MIYVIGPRDKAPENSKVINVTSKVNSPFSPMLNECRNPISAVKMENAWQFSKVYKEHLNDRGEPNSKWFTWRGIGLSSTWAHRYPMGKGVLPEYTYFNGEKLDYIDARKQLYVPLYRSLLDLIKPEVDKLVSLCETNDIALWDFDGYLTDDSFEDILDNPHKKMGHAFVLREFLRERLKTS